MPILTVEIVTRPDERFPAELAHMLADRAGAILHSAPGHTWVTVRFIASEHYAENQNSSADIHPVFVSILKATIPTPEMLQTEVAELTIAIGQCCNRPPAHVHIIYLPQGAGRVAFGGKVLS